MTESPLDSSLNQQRFERVLTVVASEDIRRPDWDHIKRLVTPSAECATRRLTLVLVNKAFTAGADARAGLFPHVQRFVTTITSLAYTSTSSPVVTVDVLLFGWSDLRLGSYTWDQIYSNSSSHLREIVGEVPHQLIEPEVRLSQWTDSDGKSLNESPVDIVSVNGTFDHLHAGHRNHILLSAWLAAKTLLLAVSTASPSDQTHKKLFHLSEPFQRRRTAIQQYAEGFQTTQKRPFELKIVPRQDYGPQVSEKDLNAIVLSTESQHHGDIVNRLRHQAGLQPVRIFVVDVVQAHGATFSLHDMSHKISSRMSSSSVRGLLEERALKFVLLNGFVGIGKHTIASHLAARLAVAKIEARVVHNHLLVDLADAVLSRAAPTYQAFRRQLRDLVFDTIRTNQHVSPHTTFIFTGNMSQSTVGRMTVDEYETAALHCGALFIPVSIQCSIEELQRRIASKDRSKVSSYKLLDPVRGAEIVAQKTLYRFEHAQALNLDVSSMSPEQAADSIAKHILEIPNRS